MTGDPVGEHIARRNAERAAEHNPLFRKPPAPKPLPPELAADPVGAFIRRRNEAAAARPNPLLPTGAVVETSKL